MGRIILEDFLAAEEKRLGLPPLSEEAAKAFLEDFANSPEGQELKREVVRALTPKTKRNS